MSKVLIIEADEDYRYLYQIALKFQRLDILVASNAEEGLKVAISEKPALILLDVMVPDIESSDLLHQIQQSQRRDLPVIIITDLRDGEAEKEAAVYGACEYLSKGSPVGDVINSVRKYIGK